MCVCVSVGGTCTVCTFQLWWVFIWLPNCCCCRGRRSCLRGCFQRVQSSSRCSCRAQGITYHTETKLGQMTTCSKRWTLSRSCPKAGALAQSPLWSLSACKAPKAQKPSALFCWGNGRRSFNTCRPGTFGCSHSSESLDIVHCCSSMEWLLSSVPLWKGVIFSTGSSSWETFVVAFWELRIPAEIWE